jgi:hypothetical protein
MALVFYFLQIIYNGKLRRFARNAFGENVIADSADGQERQVKYAEKEKDRPSADPHSKSSG